MSSRKQIEKFRDDNPDLAPLPQLALNEGEESTVWARVERLIALDARPEMTERECRQRSDRWAADTTDLMAEPALMAERLKGQLQAYEMSLFRFSQFNFDRAIEITRGELAGLEGSITYLTEEQEKERTVSENQTRKNEWRVTLDGVEIVVYRRTGGGVSVQIDTVDLPEDDDSGEPLGLAVMLNDYDLYRRVPDEGSTS